MIMGAWGLLGWGAGGFAVAAWIVWLTQPPPWLAVIVGGLAVVLGWIAGLIVIGVRERDGDSDGPGPGPPGQAGRE